MLLFLSKRIIQAVFTMLIISIISFSIQDQLVAPLRELLGESVSEADR